MLLAGQANGALFLQSHRNSTRIRNIVGHGAPAIDLYRCSSARRITLGGNLRQTYGTELGTVPPSYNHRPRCNSRHQSSFCTNLFITSCRGAVVPDSATCTGADDGLWRSAGRTAARPSSIRSRARMMRQPTMSHIKLMNNPPTHAMTKIMADASLLPMLNPPQSGCGNQTSGRFSFSPIFPSILWSVLRISESMAAVSACLGWASGPPFVSDVETPVFAAST